MSLSLNTNVPALFAAAALLRSDARVQTSSARLASGKRINSVMDDATGLAAAASLETQIRGAAVAERNASDAVSATLVNDGYLASVNDNLQQLRMMAVASGGTASGPAADGLVAQNERFRGMLTVTGPVTVDSSGNTVTGLGSGLSSVTGMTIDRIDADIASVSAARDAYAADHATFSSAAKALSTQRVNQSARYSRIMDTDYAAESANLAKNLILRQAGTAMLAQANQTPSNILALLKQA